MKKIISYLIAFMMVFTMMPYTAFAESLKSNEETVSYTWVNPLYEDVISEEDLQTGVPAVSTFSTRSIEYAATPEDAAAVVRENMVNRVTSFILYYQYPISEAEANPDNWFGDLCDEIFPLALKHTGDPTEGDYLSHTYGGYNIPKTSISGDGTYYNMALPVEMTYYTTTEQEDELDTVIENLLEEIVEDGMSDYEKVKAIYDYMCTNITYDYDNLSDDTHKLKYTAYAALINKTSVCQGYANLFYRLALECGIDSRIITGEAGGGGHAWNIVKLEGEYYQVDATWDASYYETYNTYNYFLKSSFSDHTTDAEFLTDEFAAAYPISDTDYEPPFVEIIATGTCGTNLTWTVTDDGKLTISGTGDMTDYVPGETVTNAPWADYNDKISKLVLEEGITAIGENAFYGCRNLTGRLKLPSTLTEIRGFAFYLCNGFTGKLNLPESLTKIDGCALEGCDGIDKIYVPASITSIGDSGLGSRTEGRTYYTFAGSYADNYVSSIYPEAGMTYLPNESGINLDRTAVTAYCGETVQLELSSTTGSITQTPTWTSSNEEVATVDENGLVTIKDIGTATITVTADGSTSKCIITSPAVELTGISLDNNELTLLCGESAKLTAEKKPENTTNTEEFIWDSNDASVVIVSNDGTVNAVTEGTTDVTVTVGGFTASCNVTVSHDFGDWVTDKEPTCIEAGSEYRICSGCEAREENVLDATDHSWNEDYTEDVQATCTSEGSKSIHCANCTATKDETSIEMISHEYGEWIISVYATCTEVGSRYRICKYCGNEESAEIAMTEHTKYTVPAAAATCTTAGLTEGVYCSVCGSGIIKQKEVAALDHDLTTYTAKAATCTEPGWEAYESCEREGCEYTTYKEVPALKHDYKSVVTPATCLADGYTTFTCKVCGDSYEDEFVTQMGHAWDKGTVTIEPECDVIGQMTYKCTNTGCTEMKEENIPATGHKEMDVEKAATCTESGLRDGKQCSVCGEMLHGGDIVPATGHKYGVYKTTTKAGFGKKGVQTSICANSKCTAKKTKSIAAVATPKLSTTTYTFNNKAKKPAVKISGLSSKYYSVSYAKGRKNVGKYAVKVTLKGANYSGSKTVYFKINPKGVSISKLTKGKKQIKVTWKKPAKAYRNQIDGYQIRYATSSSKLKKAKPVTVKGKTATTKTIKKLKAKKKYYVQIRTYNKVGKTTYYSSWSKYKTVKTK